MIALNIYYVKQIIIHINKLKLYAKIATTINCNNLRKSIDKIQLGVVY